MLVVLTIALNARFRAQSGPPRMGIRIGRFVSLRSILRSLCILNFILIYGVPTTAFYTTMVGISQFYEF